FSETGGPCSARPLRGLRASDAPGQTVTRRATVALVVAFAVGSVLGHQPRATATAPHPSVPGMVYFAGGKTRIGWDQGPPNERPAFTADVAPFFLDVHPVTVAEFARFTTATGFRTQSEKLGESGVFGMATGKWSLVDGADWGHPRGPSAPPAADDHPATQASGNDAHGYCPWADKR